MIDLTRRSLLRGLFAAPAIVAVNNIMPVKVWVPPTPVPWFTPGGLSIGIAPIEGVVDSLTDFKTLKWQKVGFVENIGEALPVESLVIGDGRLRKAKGERDAGLLAVDCFPNDSDRGQKTLSDAEKGYENQAICVVMPDGEKNYFRGLVMSRSRHAGVDVRDRYQIGINSAIFLDRDNLA